MSFYINKLEYNSREFNKILELRHKVYVEEGVYFGAELSEDVADNGHLIIKPESYDKDALHLLISDDEGNPAGAMRIIPNDKLHRLSLNADNTKIVKDFIHGKCKSAEIGRFSVLKKYRCHSPVSALLFTAAFQTLLSEHYHFIFAEATQSLVNYYRPFGAKIIGPAVSDTFNQDKKYIPLVINLGGDHSLQRIRMQLTVSLIKLATKSKPVHKLVRSYVNFMKHH